ncbi:MAG: pyridoxamine 5'-phosphate oxidase, partial [Verrucomicrobiota bacterium]
MPKPIIPSEDLPDLRTDYQRDSLDVADVGDEPIQLFQAWFDEVAKEKLIDPNAMTLATVSGDGQVSARTVLLKGLDERGFQFFTNYESRKGRDLAENPHAALTFHWETLERQVCVRGRTDKLPDEESDRYYHSRPYGSRIGAWVSTQSEVIPNREWMEKRETEYKAKYPENEPVPRPPFWGGYVLRPARI